MIALLLGRWRETLIVLAVVSLVGAWRSREHAIEARGVALERARVADSTLAAIEPQRARVDTLVVRDTVRVRREITRLDTLRQIVHDRITDTIVVREYLRQADSTIAACSELSRNCAALRLLDSVKIRALESKLATPTITIQSCLPSNLAWGWLGAAGGYLATRALSHR